jgi:hypothetical protein
MHQKFLTIDQEEHEICSISLVTEERQPKLQSKTTSYLLGRFQEEMEKTSFFKDVEKLKLLGM